MRILTIIHTIWSRNLGGPRVQFELSAEWRRLGHTCEKFSWEDAFPADRVPCLRRFSAKAVDFVRQNAHRFDVIDAHQTNLPVSKSDLGFSGLLVARSVGLIPIYDEILTWLDRRDLLSRWGPRLLARQILDLPGMFRRSEAVRVMHRDVTSSFRHADLINLCNRDEVQYLGERYGLREKCILFPFGLADDTWASLAAAGRPPAEHQANREIVFVGNWSARKGARDWWAIVRAVRARVPDAKFRFLGTVVDRPYLLSRLGQPDVDWISVVPHYDNAALPKLLGGATVAAFPSYVEGFPFAVLETLAAGIPTVAYDAPGPREMLSSDGLVPPGETRAMADKLTALLTAPTKVYEAACSATKAAVQELRWPQIARDTMAAYEHRLNAMYRPVV